MRASRREVGIIRVTTIEDEIRPMLQLIVDAISRLDANGRAVASLTIRGLGGWRLEADGRRFGKFESDELLASGDLPLPAENADVDELVARFGREVARDAGLPAWEPPIP
jgi:hypothetical protein